MLALLTSHSGLLQNWTSGQRYLEGHGWPPYRGSVCAQRGLQVFCWPARLHQSPQSQQRPFHSDDSGLHPPQELPSTDINHSFLMKDSTRPVYVTHSLLFIVRMGIYLWQHAWKLTLCNTNLFQNWVFVTLVTHKWLNSAFTFFKYYRTTNPQVTSKWLAAMICPHSQER